MQLRTLFRKISGFVLAMAWVVHGEEIPDENLDLLATQAEAYFDLDIEDLLSTKVSSVAGTEEKWFDTPAAIYVITPQKLKQTGHDKFAEALRLVPGMDVQRYGAREWSVSARGFSESFAGNQLVLLDGRVIYHPAFGGVLWYLHDVVFEDIERIEVVRGPGATLWGANAVNGIINIITKKASATQGGFVDTSGSTVEDYGTSFRYGGKLNESSWYRIWGKYRKTEAYDTVADITEADDWNERRLGFRIDTTPFDGLDLRLQGSFFDSDRMGIYLTQPNPVTFGHDPVVRDDTVSAFNLLSSVERKLTEDEGWKLQVYFDSQKQTMVAGAEEETRSFDVDFRYHLKLGENHAVIAGAGWRWNRHLDTSVPSDLLYILPENIETDVYSWFVQDTWSIVPDKVSLMYGSKFEHNDYTGFEYQPTLRLSWVPVENQTLWASVSRAVHTPSRSRMYSRLTLNYLDQGLVFGGPPNGIPLPIVVNGNEDLDSTELIAWETGWRWKLSSELMIDLSAFFHDYDDIVVNDNAFPQMTYVNGAMAETYGLEGVVNWSPSEELQFEWTFSTFEMKSDSDEVLENDSAAHFMSSLRGSWKMSDNLALNGAAYYVGDRYGMQIDDYLRFDLGTSWTPSSGWTVTLMGVNLLEGGHEEGRNSYRNETLEVPRGLSLRVTHRF